MTASLDTTGEFFYTYPEELDRSADRAERERLLDASRYEPVLQRWRRHCTEGLIDDSGKIRGVFTKDTSTGIDNVTRVIREINQIPEAVAELQHAADAYDDFMRLSRQQVEMPVRNARRLADTTFDDNGFLLASHRSTVADWDDDHQVADRYYAEITELVREITGSRRAFSNNHLRRQSEPPIGGDGPLAKLMSGSRGPAQVVHNDFSENFGEGIIRTVASGGVPHTQTFGLTAPMLEAGVTEDELRSSRILVVNTWRSVVDEPLRRYPLGLVDRRTISRDKLRTTLIGKHPSGQPRGGIDILNAEYEPGHEWWYYPELTPDEVMMWKGYDSAEVPARPNLHSAFDDPATPADAAQRKSIEVRVLCLL